MRFSRHFYERRTKSNSPNRKMIRFDGYVLYDACITVFGIVYSKNENSSAYVLQEYRGPRQYVCRQAMEIFLVPELLKCFSICMSVKSINPIL